MAIVSTKALILQALCFKDMYGLEIFEHYLKRTKGKIAIGGGVLYPSLESLTEEGFLVAKNKIVVIGHGGRPAQVFGITEKGKIEAAKNRLLLQNLFFAPES